MHLDLPPAISSPLTALFSQSQPLVCSGHTRPVPSIAFSGLQGDGSYLLISACKDGKPFLRDGATGDWVGTFRGHKGAVWSAKLDEEGARAITGSADFSACALSRYLIENAACLDDAQQSLGYL